MYYVVNSILNCGDEYDCLLIGDIAPVSSNKCLVLQINQVGYSVRPYSITNHYISIFFIDKNLSKVATLFRQTRQSLVDKTYGIFTKKKYIQPPFCTATKILIVGLLSGFYCASRARMPRTAKVP